MPHVTGIGAIFGITSEDGVAAQKRVVLMDRSTLKIVATTLSNVDGGYSFNGLNADTNDYLVFAVDDNGSPRKEAIVYDYIQPIPAYSGSTFMGNWEKLVLKDYPAAGFFGALDANGSPINISSATMYGNGTGVTYNQSSLTPGAPHLSSTALNNYSLAIPSRVCFVEPFNNPMKASLEWVFRRSSVSTARHAGVSGIATDQNNIMTANTSRLKYIAGVIYNPSTKILTAYNNAQNADNNVGVWGAFRAIGSINLTDYPDDIQVHLTVEYANQAKIYINGGLVVTTSLVGQNARCFPTASADATNCFAGLVVHGDVTDGGANQATGRQTTVLSGPALMTFAIWTDSEILARYNALMVGSAPLETGYAKEVLLDHPSFFYRLSEANGASGFADWLTPNYANRNAKIFNQAGIDYSQASPVIGRSAVKFNGGAAARTNYGQSASSSLTQATFKFILKPSLATPTNTEMLVSLQNTSESAYLQVYRATTGKLVLTVRAGTAIDYTFNTIIPITEEHFVDIVLNKNLLTAELFVDAVLTETIAVTATNLSIFTVLGESFSEVMIGGVVGDTFSSMTSGYSGILCEVAFYPTALSASRIQAHYDARTIV